MSCKAGRREQGQPRRCRWWGLNGLSGSFVHFSHGCTVSTAGQFKLHCPSGPPALALILAFLPCLFSDSHSCATCLLTSPCYCITSLGTTTVINSNPRPRPGGHNPGQHAVAEGRTVTALDDPWPTLQQPALCIKLRTPFGEDESSLLRGPMDYTFSSSISDPCLGRTERAKNEGIDGG